MLTEKWTDSRKYCLSSVQRTDHTASNQKRRLQQKLPGDYFRSGRLKNRICKGGRAAGGMCQDPENPQKEACGCHGDPCLNKPSGLCLEMMGLNCDCCGDASVHLCLLPWQSVYSPEPHKDPENHRTREHCER